MKPSTTITVVQTLDDDGEIISETITTVEHKPVEKEPITESFGMYL